jgi:hypothetical protein
MSRPGYYLAGDIHCSTCGVHLPAAETQGECWGCYAKSAELERYKRRHYTRPCTVIGDYCEGRAP